MKIGIDARAAFEERTGKGQMVHRILHTLMKTDSQNEYWVFLERDEDIDLPTNFHEWVVADETPLWHTKVVQVCKQKKIDCYFSPTSYIVPAISKFPSVMIVSDLVALLKITKHQPKASWVEQLTLKRAARNAKRIIAISQNTKDDLVKYFPEAEKKTDVVYLAAAAQYVECHLEGYKKIVEELRLPEEFILFVGTLEPRKNVEGLLQAYALYRDSVGHKNAVPLVIVGAQGWYYNSIYRLIAELQLGDSVIFTGYIKDEQLPCFYQKARCFVFPSLYEGFGLIILEAFRYRCPVITSHVSSLPEVAGDAAEYIDPHKPEEIAKAMEKVLGDSEYAKNLANKGEQQLAKFSWEKTTEEILRVIERANEQE